MVDGIGGVTGHLGTSDARRAQRAYLISDPYQAADSVELSADVMRLRGVEGVRLENVMRMVTIKRQIDSGTYDLGDERVGKALDRIFDRFAAEDAGAAR